MSKQELFGVYRGFVEYINDPLQTGRLKVRIPNIYGLQGDTPTENLPWALTCSNFGGGHDFGSKMIPPVGSTVFVVFEGGKVEYPIVIGTWDGIPNKPVTMLRNPKLNLPRGEVSMSPTSQNSKGEATNTPWLSSPGPDPPGEFLRQVNHRPETSVPFKTVKGTAIIIEERDEVEHTDFIDRAGQGLFMKSPFTKDANISNKNQRGVHSSNEGDALLLSNSLTNEASISLIDISGQSLKIETKEDGNHIQLISRENVLGNINIPSSTYALIDMNSGDKNILLEIVDKGTCKARIKIDGNTGVLDIVSSLLTKIKSETITLQGDVNIDGNLIVNKNLTTLENGFFGGDVLSGNESPKNSLVTIPDPIN